MRVARRLRSSSKANVVDADNQSVAIVLGKDEAEQEARARSIVEALNAAGDVAWVRTYHSGRAEARGESESAPTSGGTCKPPLGRDFPGASPCGPGVGL